MVRFLDAMPGSTRSLVTTLRRQLVIPNARSAQALGVLLWFVMLILGGAGPPPEVLTGAMDFVGRITPLRHAVRALQDSWLSLDAGLSWLIVALIFMVATAAAIRFFRWE